MIDVGGCEVGQALVVSMIIDSYAGFWVTRPDQAASPKIPHSCQNTCANCTRVRIHNQNIRRQPMRMPTGRFWAPVVACCDAPPVLEPGEAVFALVALAVSGFVMRDRYLTVLSGRDARRDPLVFRGFAIPVRIVSSVRQHVFGGRKVVQQCSRADVIAPLAGRQKHPQRAASRVCYRVQFRVHPALGAPDQAAAPPFFSPRLEAVRCVFRWGLS